MNNDFESFNPNDLSTPTTDSVSALGAPTFHPTGKPDYNGIAKELSNVSVSFDDGQDASTEPPDFDVGSETEDAPLEEDQLNQSTISDFDSFNPVKQDVAAPDLKLEAGEFLNANPSLNLGSINQAAFKSGLSLDAPDDEEQRQVQQLVSEQDEQMGVLAASRFSPEKITEFKSKPIGFFEAFTKLNPPLPKSPSIIPRDPISAELDQIGNLFKLNQIAEKKARGEDISEGDQQNLNNFIDYQVETNLRGFSWDGSLARGIASIPSWVAQFALTAGAGSLAREVVTKGAEKAALGAVTTKVAGVVTSGVTRTALMPGVYTKKAGEILLNDGVAVTDKGQAIFTEGKVSPAMAALKGFAYTGAEVAGQLAAPGVGKFLVNPVTKAVKTPLIAAVNRLPAAVRDGFYQAFKAIQPNAQVSKIFTAAGWSGMLEQLGANRVTDILHATTDLSTDKEYGYDDYMDAITPSKDQLLVEGGLISIAGAVHSATSLTVNVLKDRGIPEADALETANQMTALEQENFVQQTLALPRSEYPSTATNDNSRITEPEARMAELERAYDSPEATPEQKASIQENMDALSVEAIKPYKQEAFDLEDVSRETPQYEFEGNTVSLDATKSDAETIAVQRKVIEAGDPPPIDNTESNWNAAYRLFVHDTAPLEEPYRRLVDQKIKDSKASGKKVSRAQAKIEVNRQYGIDVSTPMFLALHNNTSEQIAEHLMVHSYKWSKEGVPEVTGKAMKSIYDDFDNMFIGQEPNLKVRRQDFENYLVARHLMHISENLDDVKVSNEQLSKAVQDLAKLEDKYGDNFKFFDTFGMEVVDYRNRTRDMYVGNLLTEQQRAAEKARYPFSIPLQRIMDDAPSDGAISNKVRQDSFKPRQKLQGSEREIRNVTDSILRETANTVSFVSAQRVLTSLKKSAEVLAPDKVQITSPKLVKTGEVKVTYDKGLRAALDKIIADLGATEGKKYSNSAKQRGSFNALEDVVRMRIGSNDGVKAHEIGHLIDKKFNLQEKFLGDKDVAEELRKLAHERVSLDDRTNFEKPDVDATKYQKYIESPDEVIANLVEGYVITPKLVEQIAPKAKAIMDALVSEDLSFLQEIRPTLERGDESIPAYDYEKMPENSVEYWENGKRKFMTMSKPMYDSLMSMRPTQISFLEKMTTALKFASAAPLLRFGATATPEFAMRNLVKDNLEATVQSGVKYNFTQLPKAMFNLIKKSDVYHEARASGGFFGSFMALDDASLDDIFQDIKNPKRGLAALINRPLEKLEYPNKVFEQSTRLGVYMAAIKQGYTPSEGAFAAIDATLNFKRGGLITKQVNKFWPFLNVGFQATDKLVRAFRDDPATMTARGLAYLTLPAVSAAGYYLFQADEKTRREYQEIPEYRILTSIPIKVGDEWRYIPLPYALGYAFGGVPQTVLRSLAKDRPDDGKNMYLELIGGAFGALSPINDMTSALTPAGKTLIEDITNYNTFTGDTLYPTYLEGNKVAQQQKTNPYDSDTSKAISEGLGKYGVDVSPAVIDHTVTGTTASLGRYGIDLSDWLLNKSREYNGEKVPASPETDATTPIKRAFTMSDPSGKRSNSYHGFEKHLGDAVAAASRFKKMDDSKKSEFYKDNRELIEAAPGLKSAEKEIKGINKQKAEIYDDKNMNGKQKAARIKVLDKQITEIARRANQQYSNAAGAK